MLITPHLPTNCCTCKSLNIFEGLQSQKQTLGPYMLQQTHAGQAAKYQ